MYKTCQQLLALYRMRTLLKKRILAARKPLTAAWVLLCVFALQATLLVLAPECKPWVGTLLKLFCQTLTVLTLPLGFWFSNNVLLFYFKSWLETPQTSPTPQTSQTSQTPLTPQTPAPGDGALPRRRPRPRRSGGPGASNIPWNRVLRKVGVETITLRSTNNNVNAQRRKQTNRNQYTITWNAKKP